MRHFMSFASAAAFLAAGACEPESPPADAGVDAAVDSDAGAISCGTNHFPAIDRSCRVTGDCTVVEHQINCCGTLRALGIRATAKVAFDRAEANCLGGYPLCRCATQITQADDGSTQEGSNVARAECVAGQCVSSFVPADPGICTPGGKSCGVGFSCCYPCGIEGCDFRCEPTCSAGAPGCADGCLLRP